MFKFFVSTLVGCLFSWGLLAQTQEVKELLSEIEQNNPDLKAYQAYVNSRELEFSTQNNLPDPQAVGFYLPLGNHTTGDYTEFQFSQSFEFPTVYASRNKWISQETARLQIQYEVLRQETLLEAKWQLQELIFLNKIEKIEQERLLQARQVFEQIRELYEQEEIGILDFNKAKIAWMQNQFELERIELERNNVLTILKQLNGGEKLVFEQPDYVESLSLLSLDSLWHEIQMSDPSIIVLWQNEEVAISNIELMKQKSLPNFTVGVNYQGVRGENYSGLYGGLSIPLWSNRNKVKTAEAQHRFQQSRTLSLNAQRYSSLERQYQQFVSLRTKYQEYQRAMADLNTESLLLEAYQLGQISFLNYYMELQFYRQAFNKMLQVERELYQLKAKILKHRLLNL